MKALLAALRGLVSRCVRTSTSLWQKYRSLSKRSQIGIALIAIIVVVGLFVVFGDSSKDTSAESLRYVTLRPVGELGGTNTSGTIFGVIRSVSEATVLSESSGAVTSVHTTLGAYVPAGTIIAELENASERATVLQAEGVYDAAVAAQQSVSLSQTKVSAETAYRNAYTTLDSVFLNYVDTFFAGLASNPNLAIDGGGWENALESERAGLYEQMIQWRKETQSLSGSEDPTQLLDEATSITERAALFLDELSRIANRTGSGATATQLSGIATARTSVSTLGTTLSAAQSTYRSGSVSSTASVDAGVKQALGALRGAQATLEKTRFRAPITGTVNFLPIRVGDFVTQNMHVATIAQNHALEAVAYVSEATRNTLTVGMSVVVENTYTGVITAIAPALDPVTKQIEVRVAVTDAPETLVNGSSVKITLAEAPRGTEEEGPLSLPLTSVKLRSSDRVVFGVDSEGRLVPYLVTTGDVHGDRIDITSDLPRALSIVTDARGLAEGQKVSVSE